jgi:type IV secretion system protein VirB9
MIKLALALYLATSGMPATQTSAQDMRVRTLTYDETQVVPIQAASNYQVTLLFAGEQITNVAIGDVEGWEATLNGQGDALFLKPLRSGGTTNMTVITDARHYAFELSARPNLSPDTPFTIRFTSGAFETGSATPGLGRYRLSGSQVLRPVSIDDDGRRTFILWSPTQPLPAVFAQNRSGEQTLLQGQVRNGRYVIDGVHETLVFRAGRQTTRAVRQRTGP